MLRRWGWLLVLAVTLAVWAPVLTYQWVETWDDAVFILGNPHVTTWDWPWMLTTQWYGHWMPLTWISFVGSYALFGFQPMPWHAVNIGLHTVSAMLVFFIARRLVGSDSGAIIAALLFAVHPLRMESVAWITERKDVLMGVFFLGAILLWMQGRRVWAFVAFIAACASKSPAVMLPVWLLALEWVEHRTCCRGIPAATWRRLSPFIAVSAVVTIMAFWSLHSILISIPWSVVGLGPRLLQMAYSEVFYVVQTLYPSRLSGLIEYTWVPSWDQPQYPLAVGVCVVGAVVLLLTWRRWPALTASAAAYTVAILPQSGLFQNGPQLVANRYSYLACIPLALLAGGAFTIAWRRLPSWLPLGTAAAIIGGFVAVTLAALPMWRTGDAMWAYAAEHEPTCTQCQDMAAAADLRHGQFAVAIARQEQAIRVSATTMFPRYERHWNLAAVNLLAGDQASAIREFRIYLASVPEAGRDAPDHRHHMDRARAALKSLGVEP